MFSLPPRSFVTRHSSFVICLAILVLPCVSFGAQSRSKSEPESHYRKWLDQDVVYIVTPEERDVFLKLTTDEERERFIEQFWARRDPDSSTSANEFREEHYRRIQYANERFHAGIPGWRTDRGRIYIAYGPPDRIESHPVGGQYLRPAQEGGGQTSTYPFERWEYRHIEGIGEDIEVEFVDVSGGNLYKLTTNPFEKDELLYVPGMGLTDRERLPGGDDPEDLRRSRVLGIRDAGSAKRMGIYGERAKYSPFARTELAANLSKPPSIRFKDLREKITTRITYNAIAVDLSYHCVRLSESKTLVPVVMSVPNKVLTFQQEDGLATNQLQIYGRVTSLTGRLVFEFDEEIRVSYHAPDGRLSSDILERRTLYRRPLALDPGVYRLDAAIREISSGKIGTTERGITIPNLAKGDRLKLSPVVLAADLQQARTRSENLIGQDALLGPFKIGPNYQGSYGRDDYLAIYFEIYDYATDPSTNAASLAVEYAITPRGSAQRPAFRDVTRSIVVDADRVLVPRQIGLSAYESGQYEIRFRVTDKISGQTATQAAPFRIQ